MNDRILVSTVNRTLYASVAFLCHLSLCSLAVTGFYGFEKLMHLLFGSDNPLLFSTIPLAWLFQAIDGGIITVFGYCGIRESYEHLRGSAA